MSEPLNLSACPGDLVFGRADILRFLSPTSAQLLVKADDRDNLSVLANLHSIKNVY